MKRLLHRLLRRPLKKAIRVLDEKSLNRSSAAKAAKAFEQWVRERRYTEPTESTETPLMEMGLTSSELSYFCKARFGKPFLTVRKVLRIQEAKNLMMEHPERTVSEIGSMVGFSDASNFRHQFKSVEGMTPTEWKEKQKKVRINLDI